jgi:hypothetical protein
MATESIRTRWTPPIFIVYDAPADVALELTLGERVRLVDPDRDLADQTAWILSRETTFLALAVGAGSALLEAYTIEVLGIGSFSGNFYLASLALTGEQADAVTFTATIQSSGAITFT